MDFKNQQVLWISMNRMIVLIQDGLNKFKQDFFNFRQEQQQQQQQQRRALYELLFAVKNMSAKHYKLVQLLP